MGIKLQSCKEIRKVVNDGDDEVTEIRRKRETRKQASVKFEQQIEDVMNRFYPNMYRGVHYDIHFIMLAMEKPAFADGVPCNRMLAAISFRPYTDNMGTRQVVTFTDENEKEHCFYRSRSGKTYRLKSRNLSWISAQQKKYKYDSL